MGLRGRLAGRRDRREPGLVAAAAYGQRVRRSDPVPQMTPREWSPGMGVSAGAMGAPEPLFEPHGPTPLDDGDRHGEIPGPALWAMESRRHARHPSRPGDPGCVRMRVGDPDDPVWAVDDGPDHRMIAHRGRNRSGPSDSYLVGRVPAERLEDLRSGDVAPSRAFDGASDLTVCDSVDDGGIGNVVFVAHYGDVSEVPSRYLPGGSWDGPGGAAAGS